MFGCYYVTGSRGADLIYMMLLKEQFKYYIRNVRINEEKEECLNIRPSLAAVQISKLHPAFYYKTVDDVYSSCEERVRKL